MKKLEDYKGQKIAIHFPAYELWLRRKEINPSDDCFDNDWSAHNIQYHYYLPFKCNGTGDNCILKYCKKNGYTILPATDFLEDEFIYGQEYEFSYDKNFKRVFNEQFMCRLPNGIFVGWNGKEMSGFNYARKINTERNEAITTIKELVSKFSINQNEVF